MRRQMTPPEKLRITITVAGAALMGSLWVANDITNAWLTGAHSLPYTVAIIVTLGSAAALGGATIAIVAGLAPPPDATSIEENKAGAIMIALIGMIRGTVGMAIGLPAEYASDSFMGVGLTLYAVALFRTFMKPA